MNKSMSFNTYMLPLNHHHNQDNELRHYSRKFPRAPFSVILPYSLWPQVIITLLSVKIITLCFLILLKQHHTECILFDLALLFIIILSIFIHCLCVCRQFVPFYCGVVFHYMAILQLVSLFIWRWDLSCFQFWAITSKASRSIHV